LRANSPRRLLFEFKRPEIQNGSFLVASLSFGGARALYPQTSSMDFASLLSAQISKSKPPPSSESASQNKYIRRGDLEAAREKAYAEEQAALEAAREERAAKKRKREEEEAEASRIREEKTRRLAEESKRRKEEEDRENERRRRRRLGLPELPPGMDDNESTQLREDEEDIPDDELKSKLRELNEPAVLFGESHIARLRRYYKLTNKAIAPVLTEGPIPTTLVPVPEADILVPTRIPTKSDLEGRKFLYRQLATYFTLVLTEWSRDLAARDRETKESSSGRAAENTMVQSRENMRPLFKRFERGDLDDGLLEPIVQIVRACQERRYVDANDGYLKLSIGKA